jgi:hypothetical protein
MHVLFVFFVFASLALCPFFRVLPNAAGECPIADQYLENRVFPTAQQTAETWGRQLSIKYMERAISS